MADDIFADFPTITPGRITWGDLRRIQAWRESHGIGQDCSQAIIDAYREEGHGAAAAGLQMGLIDYGQASGEVD